MKNIIFTILLIFGLTSSFAQLRLGDPNPSPNANAQLEVTSTDKGVHMPRLNQTQANTLASNLDATDNGMLIYNTDEDCLQVWKVDKFECVFITTGLPIGNTGAVKVNVRNVGATNETALDAANAGDDTHPGYLGWGTPTFFFGFLISWPEEGDIYPLDFNPSDLVFSSYPTTSWPENASDTTLSGIYSNDEVFPIGSEVNDAWIENDSRGQVHFWRVQAYAQHDQQGSFEGCITLTMRNPETGFSTSSTQFAPAQSGIYELTFLFVTIADDSSLPTQNGFGYVLEAQASQPTLVNVWIDSITRITLLND